MPYIHGRPHTINTSVCERQIGRGAAREREEGEIEREGERARERGREGEGWRERLMFKC